MTASVLFVGPRRKTLADTLPGAATRDAVLIIGFALLTAGAAQISIPLAFTPVPLTGQTFAVLLAGGTLGASRGTASQLLYVALGAIGLPFYADGAGGWSAATGSTAGYLVGFIVAAGLIGWLAEHGNDRKVPTAVPMFAAGTLIMYVLGALWLAHSVNVPLYASDRQPSAWEWGIRPFLIGDVLKALLAGLLLPAAWRVRTIVEGERPND
jgi:biotin transport system substrate-specific component